MLVSGEFSWLAPVVGSGGLGSEGRMKWQIPPSIVKQSTEAEDGQNPLRSSPHAPNPAVAPVLKCKASSLTVVFSFLNTGVLPYEMGPGSAFPGGGL